MVLFTCEITPFKMVKLWSAFDMIGVDQPIKLTAERNIYTVDLPTCYYLGHMYSQAKKYTFKVFIKAFKVEQN